MPPRFANKETELIARGMPARAFSGIADRAERRLDQVLAATALSDLSLPGLRLEALKGNRAGLYLRTVRCSEEISRKL
jgi:plasmid maintenance system killer protein